MDILRLLAAAALIVTSGIAHSEIWSCTVEESKAVSENGKFGESTLSPATIPAFQTFEVSTGAELYVKGGPFNLPDNMEWALLSKGDPNFNGVTILGIGENSARTRYVLFNLESYRPGVKKPFFATDGGAWLLYAGLCLQT